MRLAPLYALIFSAWFASCELKPEKVRHRIVLRKVFASPEAADSAISRPGRFPQQQNDTSYIEYVFKGYNLVDIKTMDSTIQVDLRYADTNNFLKLNLYDGLRKAYFTCEMAIRLCAAQHYLKQADPGLSLVVLDASRPQHIQQLMWDSLKLPPLKKFNYLSPPEETSLHNYGCAADVTIMDLRTGAPLDMGTGYDFFEKLSHPLYEAHFLKTGELSREAFANRHLLRKVMKRARLNPINTEWWHFSCISKEEAMSRYPLIR